MLPALIAVVVQSVVLKNLVYQPEGLNLGFLVAAALAHWRHGSSQNKA